MSDRPRTAYAGDGVSPTDTASGITFGRGSEDEYDRLRLFHRLAFSVMVRYTVAMGMLRCKLNEEKLRGKRVAVGLSGGADSVALLHLLCAARSDTAESFRVCAIHVNHHLRETATRDEEFVTALCDSLAVPLYRADVDVADYVARTRQTTEQAARTLRYGVFEQAVNSGFCDYVALAHHRDDMAETVFMRVIRGTGIAGLCGIAETNGYILRPLLHADRRDIEEYDRAHGLEYVHDETNDETLYTRNFLRHTIMSPIKDKFPQSTANIARLARNATEIEDYLRAQAMPYVTVGEYYFPHSTPTALEGCALAEYLRGTATTIPVFPTVCYISSGDVAALHPAVRQKVLWLCFRALGVFADIEEVHFEILTDFLRATQGKSLSMPFGVTVWSENDLTVFERAVSSAASDGISQNEKLEYILPQNKVVPFECTGCTHDEVRLNGHTRGDTIFFDTAKIPVGVVVRNRKTCDTFTPFRGKQRNLGDYMTDKKIPRRLRERIPVLAVDSTVLAVANIAIADCIAVDKQTETANIFTFEYK